MVIMLFGHDEGYPQSSHLLSLFVKIYIVHVEVSVMATVYVYCIVYTVRLTGMAK